MVGQPAPRKTEEQGVQQVRCEKLATATILNNGTGEPKDSDGYLYAEMQNNGPLRSLPKGSVSASQELFMEA